MPASSFVGLRKIKILIKTLSQHCFKKTIVLRSDLHAIPRSRHPAHGGATQAGKILELPSLFSGFPEASKVPVITSHAAAYCSRRQPTQEDMLSLQCLQRHPMVLSEKLLPNHERQVTNRTVQEHFHEFKSMFCRTDFNMLLKDKI